MVHRGGTTLTIIKVQRIGSTKSVRGGARLLVPRAACRLVVHHHHNRALHGTGERELRGRALVVPVLQDGLELLVGRELWDLVVQRKGSI